MCFPHRSGRLSSRSLASLPTSVASLNPSNSFFADSRSMPNGWQMIWSIAVSSCSASIPTWRSRVRAFLCLTRHAILTDENKDGQHNTFRGAENSQGVTANCAAQHIPVNVTIFAGRTFNHRWKTGSPKSTNITTQENKAPANQCDSRSLAPVANSEHITVSYLSNN